MIKWNGQNIRPYDQIDKKMQDLFVVRNGINSAPTTRLIKNAGFICCEERNKFRPYDQIFTSKQPILHANIGFWEIDNKL